MKTKSDIKNYQLLAAEIVKQASYDLVVTMAYQRDLEKTLKKHVKRELDRNRRELQKITKANTQTKKVREERIRKYREKVDEIDRLDRENQAAIEETEKQCADLRLTINRLRKNKKSASDERYALKHLNEKLRRRKDKILSYQNKREDLRAKIKEQEEFIASLDKQIEDAKVLATKEGTLALLREMAEKEKDAIIDWMFSNQFTILSNLDPEALIEQCERAVEQGQEITYKKNTYYWLYGDQK